ncbi:MAG: acyl carrier protein [Bacteroidota bacterium]|nr:acyl carrier protein [Bacteroidota bacterium]
MEKLLIDITQYLPHRKPMLMVDAIVDISHDRVCTEFLITPSCIFLQNNQLQESGVIEHIAQTCSSIVAQEYFVNTDVKCKLLGFITGIKSIKILKKPMCDDKIRSYARLKSRLDQQDYVLCSIECQTFCNDINIAQAEISLILSNVLNVK